MGAGYPPSAHLHPLLVARSGSLWPVVDEHVAVDLWGRARPPAVLRFLLGWRRLRPPWGTPLPLQGMPNIIYGAWRGRALPTAEAHAGVGGAWDALQNSTSGKACVQISPKRVNF